MKNNFWGSFLGAILGNVAVGVISTIIVIAVIVSIFSTTLGSVQSSQEESLKDNSVLKVSLDYNVADRPYVDPFSSFAFSGFDNNFQLGLNELIPALEHAAKDDKIKGIYLEIESLPSGMATLEEIRKALADFKKSGKFIVAYSEGYSQKAYYIATVGDEIYLNKEGFLDFAGLSAEVEFYKNMLDKIGVKAEAIRPTGNRFKSAVEPFITDKMSEANRAQMTLLLNTIWDDILTATGDYTGWNKDSLNAFANDYRVAFPKDAASLNFVDQLVYADEIDGILKSKAGVAEDKDMNIIRVETYFKKVEKKLNRGSDDQIAVVYASGAIIRGKGMDNVVGSDDFVKAIRDARKDEDIKAIVLRINSPGGDALASELIWREVILAKEVKPVVVSMGNYAASGGYYIACAADTIVADHNTLTGSIGVFSLLMNTGELFTDKIGITFDTVKTNRLSDFPSTNRDFTEKERGIMQRMVNDIYETFLLHVAEGRNMTRDDVDSIAQGRVWTGKDAIDIGLVDMIGGLDTTIAIAARMAGIKDYELVTLPEDNNPLNKIFRDMSASGMVDAYLKNRFADAYNWISKYEEVKQFNSIQARIPYRFEIE